MNIGDIVYFEVDGKVVKGKLGIPSKSFWGWYIYSEPYKGNIYTIGQGEIFLDKKLTKPLYPDWEKRKKELELCAD